MAIELITGRAGTPHVDSFDVGAFNAATIGPGVYILDGATATLADANNVNISAGELLCEGRHVRITGTGENLVIENGTSAYKRHDIIAAKYLRDGDGIESTTLVVIKGTPAVGTAYDPEMPTSGKLLENASEVYWPLYRIVIDGLTPQTPVMVAEENPLTHGGVTVPAWVFYEKTDTEGGSWQGSSFQSGKWSDVWYAKCDTPWTIGTTAPDENTAEYLSYSLPDSGGHVSIVKPGIYRLSTAMVTSSASSGRTGVCVKRGSETVAEGMYTGAANSETNAYCEAVVRLNAGDVLEAMHYPNATSVKTQLARRMKYLAIEYLGE